MAQINDFIIRAMVDAQTLGDREGGQGLVEYALIIMLVSIALIGALGILKGGIGNVFNSIAGTLNG